MAGRAVTAIPGPRRQRPTGLFVRAEPRALPATVVRQFVGSFLGELRNQIQGTVPDPVDYLVMRRTTSGAGFALALAEHTLAAALAPEVLAHPTLRALAEAAADIGSVRNEIVSY